MALASIWRFWMVLLFLCGTLSLGCEKLQLQQVLNTETLSKLNAMGGRFPRQCIRERLDLKTKPMDLVRLSEGLQAQDRIQIVHQTLCHISKIYSMNLGSVTWDRDKVENVRLLLDRQLSELEECVREPESEHKMRRNSAIQKYFRKLRKFLKQKGFSDCAWEIIRTETRARLQQLLFVTAQISRRN
ncbi:interferon alpha-F-like [Carcharodon carcharias]|uniref:interferon alpha-F-like n=1 Tax=Carcharodon carcharias TaxID=13397 RepID=UPI001B7E12EE|nr:interferon alpha-F-like [Carcharodon carcharias]